MSPVYESADDEILSSVISQNLTEKRFQAVMGKYIQVTTILTVSKMRGKKYTFQCLHLIFYSAFVIK